MEQDSDGDQRKAGYRQAIVELIRSYSAYYRAKANQTDKALPSEEIRWARCTAIGTWVAAILAGFAAFVFWGQWNTAEKANENAERAWINPIFAHINLSPVIGKPFGFSIDYRNVGNSPALKINWRFDTGLAAWSAKIDQTKLAIRPNMTCNGLEPSPDGPAEYPASGLDGVPDNERVPHSFQTNSGAGNALHHAIVSARFIQGLEVFYVEGCAAYETMGEVAHSQFCYYFEPDGRGNYNLAGCRGSAAN